MISGHQENWIRENWLPALRNGVYKQGQGALHVEDRFCCLGVAADLNGATWEEVDPAEHSLMKSDGTTYALKTPDGGYEALTLPWDVAEKIGITWEGDFLPGIRLGEDNAMYFTLASLNDGAGWTFEQIADFIEFKILDPKEPYRFEELDY